MPKLPSSQPAKLTYVTDRNPEKTGVYACRIPMPDDSSGLFGKDVFLDWYQEAWYYVGSDQKCRSRVLGWIGPLPRLRPEHLEDTK